MGAAAAEPAAVSLDWRCRCGSLHLRLDPGAGMHGICYCRDCQAFHHHLDAAEWLRPGGGSDLFATTPDRLEVVSGAEHIALLRLGPKGIFRWYAACCGSPLVNGPPTRGVAFTSLHVAGLSDPAAVGPVAAYLNCKGATGPTEGRETPGRQFIFPILFRAIAARLSGRYRQTPFFRADGTPVAEPHVLSRAERAAAAPTG
ncbi:hypothetical protein HKCCE2091_11440 [Rhodobacterales bacterium HKCCE2091]|nr:hypothetical protein [Rhodobacterales bacterium HKCCE2091]